MSAISNIEQQFDAQAPVGSTTITFDQFRTLINSATVIALNSDQVVYQLSVEDKDEIVLEWCDQDGDRSVTKIRRSLNDGKMYVEPDGEVVVFDIDGDIDRVHCYQQPMRFDHRGSYELL